MVSATVDCYVFFLFSSHIFELKISRIPCLCAPTAPEHIPPRATNQLWDVYVVFRWGGEGRMMGGAIERLVLVRGFEMNKVMGEDMGASDS